ncbi:MAG TPA: SDR family NAD(P)-dependent oxidoreductase [Anaeromyxobacteraceae bacterium]|nr:SDR family NAD(P)-dependent oxidoreductase [Anaeromyxobacteraceae bacterium]
METIAGRVALVTGGGRGIGRAVALALARAGVDVAVAARTVPEIEAVAADVQALGRRAHFFPLDAADRRALAAAPAEVARALGPVDILVNNAAIRPSSPLARTSDEQWDGVLAVNLTAPFLLTRACLPGMLDRRWGRIVNVASVAGRLGVKYLAAYAASKHGLLGLTRTTALEGARKGVTANAICPSWTDTRMMAEAVQAIVDATGRTAEEARAAVLADNPRGQPASPEEVAEVAVWLASNPAVNGQAFNVDGGEVMS